MFKFALAVCFFPFLAVSHPAPSCRCMPSDTCWPSPEEWANFNQSLGGKLVATTPLALPCHIPSYNSTTCQYLKSQWTNPFLQYVRLVVQFGRVNNQIGLVMSLHLLSWRLLLPMRLAILSHLRKSTVHLGTWSCTQSMRRNRLITARQLHSQKRKIFVLLSEIPVMSMLTPVLRSEVIVIAK